MKVFITGIAGFLGSHLAEHLLAKGHQVYGCDNLIGGEKGNVPQQAMWVETDCKDFEQNQELMKWAKPDVLYHCAAAAHEGLSVFSPAFICDNVFQASVSVFSAAAQAKVKRVVFLSSMARYGHGGYVPKAGGDVFALRGPPFSEDQQFNPVDPYGIAKVAAEQVLKVLAETHGFEYQIAVPHNIIGTRQNYTDPYRNVASIFLNRLKQGKPGIIYGDGTQKRCFSPVWDILPCLETLGFGDLPNGEVWNLGPDHGEIMVNTLYQMCQAATGEFRAPEYVEGRPREVHKAWCTATKAREQLGFVETVDLAACLQRMGQDIPPGGADFVYERCPLEIVNEHTPKTWKERLI